MSAAVSHRLARWAARLVAVLAVAIGLLAMHGDFVPTGLPAMPAAAMSTGTATTATVTEAIPGAASICSLPDESVAMPSAMPGPMGCPGMLAGGETYPVVACAPARLHSPPPTNGSTIQAAVADTGFGRARPEVLRT